VTTALAAFESASDITSAPRIRLVQEYRNGFPALVKNRRRGRASGGGNAFP
jgi:hypothetical protein